MISFIKNIFSKKRYFYDISDHYYDYYILTYYYNGMNKYYEVILEENLYKHVIKNKLKLKLYIKNNYDELINLKVYRVLSYKDEKYKKLFHEPEFFRNKSIICRLETKNKKSISIIKLLF